MPKLRLDRILSEAGIVSRRESAGLIRTGAVTVNGVPVRAPAEKFDPETATITVNGRPVTYARFHYVMLNKPAGVISATEDAADKTVLDLLGPEYSVFHLFPAGRLDKDAEGLMLLTDDGDYAHRVMAPKKKVDKLYYVRTEVPLQPGDCDRFAAGITLADGTQCLPGTLILLAQREALVRIHEGKYHQVKRMLAALGKPVTYLKRLCIGGLLLDPALAPGQYRPLTETEARSVFAISLDSRLDALVDEGKYGHYV